MPGQPRVLGRRRSARTLEVPDVGDLLALLVGDHPVAWVRQGCGMVGWGVHATLRHTGSDTLEVAEQWFADRVAGLDVDDPLARPGTGPVAFVSLAFDPRDSESVVVIPRVVVGRDAAGSWVTVIGDEVGGRVDPAAFAPAVALPDTEVRDRRSEYGADGAVSVVGGSADDEGWCSTVAAALERIRAGDLDKVVLARERILRSSTPIDERTLVQRLGAAFPSCWTFTVDGLTGATPELLAGVQRGALFTRVLAGTEWGVGALDRINSPKNRAEHDYAAKSVVSALEKVTDRLEVPDGPTVLTLPNLVHLATEIRGTLTAGVQPLGLVAAMHPTAAVGGTPAAAASRVISDLEPVGRGRYAGPVGWFDSDGNCELGIALRSGQLSEDRRSIRVFAGCGIVAGSDPAVELDEADRKFGAMLDALGADQGAVASAAATADDSRARSARSP
ncbi:MAG: isochorismate synthase [Microthrixaceae bacterium]